MPPPPLNMSMSIRTATEEEDGLAGEVLGMSYGEITDSYSKANVAIHGLVWLMSSPSINDSAKASAAAAVSALAADGTENKDRIARTDGAIEALIHLSVAGGDKSRASATMAMANLVEDHVENKLLVASATPFFPAVTAVMRTGTEKARWHAARLLASVAMMPELRDTIGAEKGTLDELVRLCRGGTVARAPRRSIHTAPIPASTGGPNARATPSSVRPTARTSSSAQNSRNSSRPSIWPDACASKTWSMSRALGVGTGRPAR